MVRNAVKLGYPLYFSVKSVIDACDEFIISEGFSEDTTMEVVKQLSEEYPTKIRVIHKAWKPSMAGETIAEVTNDAMEKCIYDWIYYVQADEIVHEDNLRFIASVPRRLHLYRAISFSFIHFRLSLRYQLRGGYRTSIRMVRNLTKPWRRKLRKDWYETRAGRFFRRRYYLDPLLSLLDVHNSEDGWTFSGSILPKFRADFLKPIFHVGYVNRDIGLIAQRLESHARFLYPMLPSYEKIARAIRAGDAVNSWRSQGMSIVPYEGADYPKLLQEWVVRQGIDYNR